jgi:hypothetical protein
MPHLLPPEDENSPASPYAHLQPAAGYVAPDVPDYQNPAGGPKSGSVPGTADQQPTGEGPASESAKASDVEDFPVIEDGKAVAPKKAEQSEAKPTGDKADAASAAKAEPKSEKSGK